MNLTRLLRMSPAEIATRAQQALFQTLEQTASLPADPVFAHPRLPGSRRRTHSIKAEKICKHRFDLLGYKDLDFGTPIDWHLRPGPRQARPAQTLASDSIPGLRSDWRPQNHLGAQPPPALGHAGASRVPRRNPWPNGRTGKARTHTPSESTGRARWRSPSARCPGSGYATSSEISTLTYSPPCTSTAGTSSAFCPPTSLRIPTC